MKIVITPADPINAPRGKVADAELQFFDGPLKGIRICGFTIWESRNSEDGYNVTVPARPYTSSGEKRTFDYVRGLTGVDPVFALKQAIIAEFKKEYPNA